MDSFLVRLSLSNLTSVSITAVIIKVPPIKIFVVKGSKPNRIENNVPKKPSVDIIIPAFDALVRFCALVCIKKQRHVLNTPRKITDGSPTAKLAFETELISKAAKPINDRIAATLICINAIFLGSLLFTAIST